MWDRRMLCAALAVAVVSLGFGALALGAFASGGRHVHVIIAQDRPGRVFALGRRRRVLGRGVGRERLPSAMAAGRTAVAAADAVGGALRRCAAVRHGYGSCGNPRVLGLRAVLGDAVAGRTSVWGTRRAFLVSVVSGAGVSFLLARQADGRIVKGCSPAGVGGCSPRGTW